MNYLSKSLLLIYGIISSFTVTINVSSQDYVKYGMEVKEEFSNGLKAGDTAPLFTGIDQRNKKISLEKLLKKGKVVLFFYRGHWCPVCNKHLEKFQSSFDQITQKGAYVISVTPQSINYINKTVKRHKITYSILSDGDGQIMKNYKVNFHVTNKYQNLVKLKNMNIAKSNGQEDAELPIPATYIINQDGTIEKVFFNPNYKVRASVEDILPYL